MEIFKMKDMIGGWFVGNFEPTAYKTNDFEVSYKLHPKGEEWDMHYHKEADEINYLFEGKMRIQGKLLEAGDIFVIKKFELADPIFLEDCHIVCVKSKSVIGDKYSIEEKR